MYIYIYVLVHVMHHSPDVDNAIRRAQGSWTLPVLEEKYYINTVQFLAQTDLFMSKRKAASSGGPICRLHMSSSLVYFS